MRSEVLQGFCTSFSESGSRKRICEFELPIMRNSPSGLNAITVGISFSNSSYWLIMVSFVW